MFKNIFSQIIHEQMVLKTTQTKPLVDAIKNRKKINFDYYGPRVPKKDSVRPGRRIKVEPVAIGLNKKNKLVIRAWVEPPSISKKGFTKTNWRTFIVSRMKNIQVTDEIFDTKRPNYKEGNDGSMSVTYVTSNWDRIQKVKKIEPPPKKPELKPAPETKPKPVSKPVSEPKPEPKPIPKPKPKPTPEPEATPEPKPSPEPKLMPEPTPVSKPESITKKEPEIKKLPEPKLKPKPEKIPNQTNNDKDLKENINRIKSLMFS